MAQPAHDSEQRGLDIDLSSGENSEADLEDPDEFNSGLENASPATICQDKNMEAYKFGAHPKKVDNSMISRRYDISRTDETDSRNSMLGNGGDFELASKAITLR